MEEHTLPHMYTHAEWEQGYLGPWKLPPIKSCAMNSAEQIFFFEFDLIRYGGKNIIQVANWEVIDC